MIVLSVKPYKTGKYSLPKEKAKVKKAFFPIGLYRFKVKIKLKVLQ